MTDIVLILHNIRSTYNVGSLIRTSEGFGVKKIICSGYTPYPKIINDKRLPHIYEKLSRQIEKTSLGAEKNLDIIHMSDIDFNNLREMGYKIIGLEQTPRSIELRNIKSYPKIALLLGEELKGISMENLNECDEIVEIPMLGKKESLNVAVAAAIALYEITL